MARAAARSSPSKTMLENGRVLIADGFFFIAEMMPRKRRGGKFAGTHRKMKKGRRVPALESKTMMAD
jgi:hypothetical protein